MLAENLGDNRTNGSSVVLKDKLPTGVIAQSVELGVGSFPVSKLFGEILCEVLPEEVSCTVPGNLRLNRSSPTTISLST